MNSAKKPLDGFLYNFAIAPKCRNRPPHAKKQSKI